jgi:hypothetical protein
MARMASGAATADPTTIITQRRDCRQLPILNSFSENVAATPTGEIGIRQKYIVV